MQAMMIEKKTIKNPGHHWPGFLMFKYLLRVYFAEQPVAAASFGQPEVALGQVDGSLSQQGLSQPGVHALTASAPSAYADA
jgi:hypothetical protein